MFKKLPKFKTAKKHTSLVYFLAISRLKSPLMLNNNNFNNIQPLMDKLAVAKTVLKSNRKLSLNTLTPSLNHQRSHHLLRSTLHQNTYSLVSNYLNYPSLVYNKLNFKKSRSNFSSACVINSNNIISFIYSSTLLKYFSLSHNYLTLPTISFMFDQIDVENTSYFLNPLKFSRTKALPRLRTFNRKLLRFNSFKNVLVGFYGKTLFTKLRSVQNYLGLSSKSMKYSSHSRVNKFLTNHSLKKFNVNLKRAEIKYSSYYRQLSRKSYINCLKKENLYLKFSRVNPVYSYTPYVKNITITHSPSLKLAYSLLTNSNQLSKTNFVLNASFFSSLMVGNSLFKYTNIYSSLDAGRSEIINMYPPVAINTFNLHTSNIQPAYNLKLKNFRKSFTHLRNSLVSKNFGRWANLNSINFLEHILGQKVLVKTYPFLLRSVGPEFVSVYYMWAPRLTYYARRLGHRFFLLESLFILHISLYCRDSLIAISWLRSMILRISFWKTRVIFRFIRYVFTYMFSSFFKTIGAKGFKVKLKGKISSAGNSRKRTIMYRFGKCSYSSVNNKCLYSMETVNTFTGVLGLQLWIFY